MVEAFKAAGVEILTVAGYAQVAAEGDDEAVSAELAGLVKLARDLGARYVRVFPGGGDQDPADADATAARRLGAAAPAAADSMGVSILLETHDTHRRGRRRGPGRGHGRPPQDRSHLGRPAHLAGRRGPRGQPRGARPAPRLRTGEGRGVGGRPHPAAPAGALPLAACLDGLDPETWVCWEYEKRWHPGAAELPGLLGAGRDHLLRLGAPKQ
ncbi:Sugar phosphate isomerase/epimerase OS=Streptomyces microflavus OX=1919 GN=HUT09_11315 PE=4 SV=1 [Streptomyces microflavus]